MMKRISMNSMALSRSMEEMGSKGCLKVVQKKETSQREMT